jgi:polar amino acid transport system substrate-binding protein
MESSLNAVRKGEVDLGIGATVITSNREELIDFSHSFFRTKLGILVPKKGLLNNILSILISSNILYIILILIAYIFVCAHIIWLIERKSSKWNLHKGYFKGVAHGSWWTISTMSTVGYGDVYPNRTIGKLFGSFVMFSGILIFSLAIATFTSIVTINQLQNTSIQGPEALKEKPVAAFKNSIAAYVGTEKNMHVIEVNDVDTAIDYLKENKTMAYIDDCPLLEDYLKKNPGIPYSILPYKFHYIDYGIEFKRESDLTKEFNRILLIKI